MKKIINLFIILFAAAFLFSGCQKGGGEEESESFKKYGQEFEGKIAKSYQDSEEWWPMLLSFFWMIRVSAT
jgi:protein involved in sex pheromone biosynthesis